MTLLSLMDIIRELLPYEDIVASLLEYVAKPIASSNVVAKLSRISIVKQYASSITNIEILV